MAITVGKIILLFFVNSLIIIHFGRNPDRGGRPPSDSIDRRIMVDIIGVLFHKSDSERVVVDELNFSSVKTVVVSIM